MIHYDLLCGANHRFDGWFRDSAAFDMQAAQNLLECPVCGDLAVTRALMAPAVRRRGRSAERVAAERVVDERGADVPAPAPEQPIAVAGHKMPDQLRAALQRIRSEVERNCDYVGPEFADEAVRMHRGESEKRGIYGETTPEQAEMLAEEGIEVASIPWLPRSDG